MKGLNLRKRYVIGDLTDSDDGLRTMERAMEVMSNGCSGIFTVSRNLIADKDADPQGIRDRLNTSYTLKQLIDCKSFFLAVIKNTPNRDRRTTRFFDDPRTNLENLLDKFRDDQLPFGNCKLRDGIWVPDKTAKRCSSQTHVKKGKRNIHKNGATNEPEVIEVTKSIPVRKKASLTKIIVHGSVRR